jgi:hypothetical protein
MSINFIPNDPSALTQVPMRKVAPLADAASNRAGYEVAGAAAEGEYDVGTPEFLYWQCRQAALAALEAWQEVHGPFTSWQEDESLSVYPDLGVDLNAYYDRARGGLPERISFFHQQVGNKTYFSGASTDVVAHEAGHAFLDALRPDFWTSFRFEVNAFHEAFGDCVAMLTALHDKLTRGLVAPIITARNPVESTAEELADAIKKAFPGHNAGAPRRARNDFEWGPQGSIPVDGGPGELIYEEHSFGQVFSGCFYDTIANIFAGMASQSEANLLKAAQTAGKLLVKATLQAPQRAQYFREVGRVMVLVDEQDNAGANGAAITDAFARHNIALGTSMTLAPQAALAGAAPAGRGAAQPTLPPVAKRNLLKKFGAEAGAKLAVAAVKIAGHKVNEAIYERLVRLDAVHQKLKGVVAAAPQVAVLGTTHNALAILGHLSNGEVTVEDVEGYVKSLVHHARVDFNPEKPARRRPRGRGMVAAAAAPPPPKDVTHEVQKIRGQKTLVRVRFACRCQ